MKDSTANEDHFEKFYAEHGFSYSCNVNMYIAINSELKEL
jgi:hypothetical protein